MPRLTLALLTLALAACSTTPVADAPSQRYDLLVRNTVLGAWLNGRRMPRGLTAAPLRRSIRPQTGLTRGL